MGGIKLVVNQADYILSIHVDKSRRKICETHASSLTKKLQREHFSYSTMKCIWINVRFPFFYFFREIKKILFIFLLFYSSVLFLKGFWFFFFFFNVSSTSLNSPFNTFRSLSFNTIFQKPLFSCVCASYVYMWFFRCMLLIILISLLSWNCLYKR